MKTFHEALEEHRYGWDNGWEKTLDGREVVTIEGRSVYTIELEPLLGGQWYLAIYCSGHLIAEKIPIRPGGYRE